VEETGRELPPRLLFGAAGLSVLELRANVRRFRLIEFLLYSRSRIAWCIARTTGSPTRRLKHRRDQALDRVYSGVETRASAVGRLILDQLHPSSAKKRAGGATTSRRSKPRTAKAALATNCRCRRGTQSAAKVSVESLPRPANGRGETGNPSGSPAPRRAISAAATDSQRFAASTVEPTRPGPDLWVRSGRLAALHLERKAQWILR